jgi:hypothetical protein
MWIDTIQEDRGSAKGGKRESALTDDGPLGTIRSSYFRAFAITLRSARPHFPGATCARQ